MSTLETLKDLFLLIGWLLLFCLFVFVAVTLVDNFIRWAVGRKGGTRGSFVDEVFYFPNPYADGDSSSGSDDCGGDSDCGGD